MGNCFRRCCGEDSDSEYVGHGYGGHGAGGAGPIQNTGVGFTAVARDLFEFETTNKVPGLLGYYVPASKATQRIWFEKLLAAWKRANPAPESAEAVAVLVIQTLQGYHGIEDLLSFYHLPWPNVRVTQPVPEVTKPEASGTWLVQPESAEDIQFEIQTLPIKWNENEGDGDGMTVFVDVGKDAREAKDVPKEIKDAVRSLGHQNLNSHSEIALQKEIEAGKKYKVFDGKNGQASCLAHKYKIRLRGVDAPEIGIRNAPKIVQAYGYEARDILRDLVKDQRLVIHVYDIDKYDRAVGDVYCRGICIQEELLKKGSVWHYKFHDKRDKFSELERAAKAARLGLWAHPNPEAPWDWRRRQKKLQGNNKQSFGKKRGA